MHPSGCVFLNRTVGALPFRLFYVEQAFITKLTDAQCRGRRNQPSAANVALPSTWVPRSPFLPSQSTSVKVSREETISGNFTFISNPTCFLTPEGSHLSCPLPTNSQGTLGESGYDIACSNNEQDDLEICMGIFNPKGDLFLQLNNHDQPKCRKLIPTHCTNQPPSTDLACLDQLR